MNDTRLRRHPLGFLEVVDRPSPQELADYYADAYYQHEASNYRAAYPPDELEVIRQRVAFRAARVHELRDEEGPGTLLDVGCGEGFVLDHFRRLGWTVTGLDHSRAGAQQMHPDLVEHVVQGDVFTLLEQLVADGARYDLVWLGNVLEHVLDPLALLTSLRAVVADAGVLVVTVPNDAGEYHEALFESGAIPRRFWIAVPDHMTYFTADSLRRAVAATGWECLDLHGDLPVDWFLAHEGSNYVADPSRGPAAHRARIMLEGMIGRAGPAAANAFAAALADVGFGRNLTAFLRPASASAA